MREGRGEGDEHTKGIMHKKKEIFRSFDGSCVVYSNVHQKNDNAFGGQVAIVIICVVHMFSFSA